MLLELRKNHEKILKPDESNGNERKSKNTDHNQRKNRGTFKTMFFVNI